MTTERRSVFILVVSLIFQTRSMTRLLHFTSQTAGQYVCMRNLIGRAVGMTLRRVFPIWAPTDTMALAIQSIIQFHRSKCMLATASQVNVATAAEVPGQLPLRDYQVARELLSSA